MNLFQNGRLAGLVLGCTVVVLAGRAQSPSPQQTQTPGTLPPISNQPVAPQQNATPPAQQPQQPEGEPPQATETLQLFSREVDLLFAVTDKHGSFVNGLQQQNFGLLDDGRPPERIIRFVQQTNLPLRAGIMIDTSSSIRQRFGYEQQAAIDFLLQVMHPVDRAFVEGFDVQTDIEQDFTNRVDLLNSGISRLRPGGGTALYDSLYKTCRDQMLTLQQTADVRKMIVLVSDGDDDYSRATEDDAIKMCQRAETIVYTISTNTGPSRDKGDDVLLRISDATGGRAFFPKRLEDVSESFINIEAELRSQYSLVYVPAGFKQDGSFRTIYLQSLDPRYVVRAKKGYFAPKPPE
jgi:VWFA-related protein